MKVSQFIKWLETQDQNLEVCVMETNDEEDWVWDGEDERRVIESVTSAVCFDDPPMQSTKTQYSLILGRD